MKAAPLTATAHGADDDDIEIVVTGTRPITMNQMLGSSRYRWEKQEWRDAAEQACRRDLPGVHIEGQVNVCVAVLCADGRRQDVGAAAPTAKLIVDAAVRAGIIDDDGPDVVRSVRYGGHLPFERHGISVRIRSVKSTAQASEDHDVLTLEPIDHFPPPLTQHNER